MVVVVVIVVVVVVIVDNLLMTNYKKKCNKSLWDSGVKSPFSMFCCYYYVQALQLYVTPPKIMLNIHIM